VFLLYYHKTDIDQWSRIESLEISPCKYGRMTSHKDAKNTEWGRNSSNSSGKLDYPHAKELNYILALYHI
jgi:hypothetical protein